MSESTKRTARTILQVLLTLAVAVPVVATQLPHNLPAYQLLAGFAGALVTIVKVVTVLEDRGWLPAFLRDVQPAYGVVDDVASAAADAAALLPGAAGEAVSAAADSLEHAAAPPATPPAP